MRENAENTGREKPPAWQTVLIWVFFPIGLLKLWYDYVSRRLRMDISQKTTMVNTAVFFLLLACYAVFVIVNAATWDGFCAMVRLICVSVVALPLFTLIFAAMCTLTSRTMLAPVRRMIKDIDEVNADDLSRRIEPADAQDELMELTDRINGMLAGLEESFRRQRDFVSDASHELRTPISVIRGYADLLIRWGKSDPAVLEEGLEAIRGEADNMRSVVEQLLYLARLGSFVPRMSEFDLAEVIEDIVEAYGMTNVDKTITTHMPDSLPVTADRSLAVELIRIVTDNAIKYTHPGGKVDIRAEARAGGGATVTVSDDGVGISAEDLPHIFDRFYRCDKARGRESGSTGLGLAIAKSITGMLGGDITVRSVPGEGSEFTIVFA